MQNWVEKQALIAPDHLAVTDGSQRLTFSQLLTDTQQINGQLTQAGFAPQKAVALLANNSFEAYRIAMALLASGRPIVWLNKRLQSTELLRQIQNSQSGGVIVEDALWRDDLANQAVSFSDLLNLPAQSLALQSEFDPNGTASIMFTSGTTGRPKGVVQTFNNHFSSAVSSMLNLGMTPTDEWLCAVPIFHISGFSILMRGLIYGMTVRLVPRFEAKMVHTILVNEPITTLSVVPFMLKKLLAQQVTTGEPYNSKFRVMLLGGGPIDLATLNQSQKAGIAVVQSYGMTETASQVVALSNQDAPAHIGSVGKPLFLTQIRLTDDQGEILLKTPALSPATIGQRTTTPRVMTPDGWYQTGDIGHFDAAGFLYVDGRVDDMIISGGENIFPDEVEAAYQAFAGLQEISVVGEKSPDWGMVPVAFIVADSSVTPEALTMYGRRKLAHYKVPKRFIKVTELPKNASGKVQRAKLRAQLAINP